MDGFELMELVDRTFDAAAGGTSWGDALASAARAIGAQAAVLARPDDRCGVRASVLGHESARERALSHGACFAAAETVLATFAADASIEMLDDAAIAKRARGFDGDGIEFDAVRERYRVLAARAPRRSGAAAAALVALRTRDAPRFGARERDVLATVVRCASLALESARSRALARQAAALSDVLGRIASGVVIVDGDLRIVYANAAAREIIDAEPSVAIEDDRLEVRGNALHASLRRAVHAAGDAPATGPSCLMIPRLAQRTPIEIVATPVDASIDADGYPDAIASLHLFDPERESGDLEPALITLYGMTPREARLSVLVARESSLGAAARVMGVSVNTARTHLKRVFRKLGVRRQSELTRRLGAGAAQLVYRAARRAHPIG